MYLYIFIYMTPAGWIAFQKRHMFCHDHSGSVAGGGPGDYVPGGVSPDDIREHMIAWETTKDGYKFCSTCGEKSYIKHDSWRKSTF